MCNCQQTRNKCELCENVLRPIGLSSVGVWVHRAFVAFKPTLEAIKMLRLAHKHTHKLYHNTHIYLHEETIEKGPENIHP